MVSWKFALNLLLQFISNIFPLLHKWHHVHMRINEFSLNNLFYMLIGNQLQNLDRLPITMLLLQNCSFSTFTIMPYLPLFRLWPQPPINLPMCELSPPCEFDPICDIPPYGFAPKTISLVNKISTWQFPLVIIIGYALVLVFACAFGASCGYVWNVDAMNFST